MPLSTTILQCTCMHPRILLLRFCGILVPTTTDAMHYAQLCIQSHSICAHMRTCTSAQVVSTTKFCSRQVSCIRQLISNHGRSQIAAATTPSSATTTITTSSNRASTARYTCVFVPAFLCLRFCACVFVPAFLCQRFCACVFVPAFLCLRFCACVFAIALFGTTTATNVQQPRFIAFADLHNEGGLNAHKFEIAHVSKIYEIGTSTSQVNTTTLKRDCHNTSYYGFSLNRMYCIIQFVYCLLCALTLTLVRQQCQRY